MKPAAVDTAYTLGDVEAAQQCAGMTLCTCVAVEHFVKVLGI